MSDLFTRMMNRKPQQSSEKSASNRPPVHQPWIEKYRPKCMDDVVYQEEVVSVLRKSLDGSDFPNFLFYGPPGTGKTSTILALAKEMFGGEAMYKQRVLELNASDERGINVVREKVKKFAQQMAQPGGKGGTSSSFKIIVLDEADSMTTQAQSALRRIMETESKSTRFCLICNYVSRIIEPIASRCAKFRFKPLKAEAIKGRLQHICEVEKVLLDSDAILDEIIDISEGDLRRAITTLQTAFRMKDSGESITLDDVHEISGHIPNRWIETITATCKTKSHDQVRLLIKDLILEGYSATQFLIQLHRWLISDACFLNDQQKSVVCTELAKADQCLLDGANEFLQGFHVASQIIEVL